MFEDQAETGIGLTGEQLRHLGTAHPGRIMHRAFALPADALAGGSAFLQLRPSHRARTVEPFQRSPLFGAQLAGMRVEAQEDAVG